MIRAEVSFLSTLQTNMFNQIHITNMWMDCVIFKKKLDVAYRAKRGAMFVRNRGKTQFVNQPDCLRKLSYFLVKSKKELSGS